MLYYLLINNETTFKNTRMQLELKFGTPPNMLVNAIDFCRQTIAQWPLWAYGSFLLLFVCFLMLQTHSSYHGKLKLSAIPLRTATRFHAFQRQYLIVYTLIIFADWLQGINMYTLYQSYGVNVGNLFVIGFIASAIFGTFIGPIIDYYGRRQSCLIFCALEVIINILEHSSNFFLLAVGRFLGGLSTSLLFSAFESWMVTEHNKNSFSDEMLRNTFTVSMICNGLVAVLAGFVGQFLTDVFGKVSPFTLAVLITIIAAIMIAQWPENYGNSQKNSLKDEIHVEEKLSIHLVDFSCKKTLLVGIASSIFEGTMFVFVLLWVPTMQKAITGQILPCGLVFSCFMVCLALGSQLFQLSLGRMSEEVFGLLVCGISALSLFLPAVSNNFYAVYIGFMIFEVCVGAFSPCCGTLRSRYFAEKSRTTLINIFRVLLNIIVILGTALSNSQSEQTVFYACSSSLLCAAVLMGVLANQSRKLQKKIK